MATSTKEVVLRLPNGMGVPVAEDLGTLLTALTNAVQAVATAIDAEAALTGTSVVTTVSAIITD
jgi:hypothetical protein